MLRDALMNRVSLAEELEGFLSELYRSEADFPYAKIYDSKAGIKAFVEKVILDMREGDEICTIENPNAGNYHRIFSKEFFYAMLDMKRRRSIATRSLVVTGSVAGIDPQKLERQNITLREMPEEIRFKASFWIIGDMLVLFSGKYPFIVAVNHKIIAGSMKSIFDYLWRVSGDAS